MKYPKMILFDYGHALLYEPGWDSVRGNKELLKYVTKNPNNCSLEDVIKGAELIFGKYIEGARKMGYDIPGQIGNRVLFEYLGIEFSLTPLEMETVFWNAASMGAVMPDADIDGASQAGIFPVWYDNDTEKDCKGKNDEYLPQCEHLHIHEWFEMIDLLERLKS